jgi:hypothetical protein
MFKRFVAGVRLAFGLHHPGRNLPVFEDDVFLVSYPKSGNTWTRFLIANLLHPEEPASFANIDKLVPDLEEISKRHLARVPRPRFIKSHQYFHPSYERVIYIVRDPRDVAVSQYHFRRKRRLLEDSFRVEQFVEQFISGAISPYYGSWGENVASWLFTRGRDSDFLLLRYEDMLENTIAELGRIAAFLHLDPAIERVAQAADRSSAEKMRKLETSQAHLWSLTKKTRQDMPFVRAAKSGGWRSELPAASVAQMEYAWGHIMQELKYPIASQSTVTKNSAALEASPSGRGAGSL